MIAMVSEKSHNDKTQDKQTENMTRSNQSPQKLLSDNPTKLGNVVLPTHNRGILDNRVEHLNGYITVMLYHYSGICCLLFVGENLKERIN